MTFAVPGDLDTPTGGYAYDKRIVTELRTMGWDVGVADLGSEFPRPSVQAKEKAHDVLMAQDRDVPVVIDGLAFGVLPELAEETGATHRVIALVHHPLALETGLSTAEADRLRASERAALKHSKRVIVTSAATARILVADYDVPPERIAVAVPGNDRKPFSQGSADGIFNLLAVGSVVPRKGYDVLVTALAALKDLPWRLTIAGDLTRDPAEAEKLRRTISGTGLGGRITCLGAVSARTLDTLNRDADLFALASRFEGYGMAFTDAIAYGVPIVASDGGGAVRDTVPRDAGILVPVDDAGALAAALRDILGDQTKRKALREGARQAAARLPRWRQSAEIFAQAIEAVS